MGGRSVRADDAHRALEERRLEELERALAALVAAWGLPERDWYRDDFDALIERARALLGGEA